MHSNKQSCIRSHTYTYVIRRNLAPALAPPPAVVTSSMSSSETASSSSTVSTGSGNEASLEDLKLYIRTLAEAQGEYYLVNPKQAILSETLLF